MILLRNKTGARLKTSIRPFSILLVLAVIAIPGASTSGRAEESMSFDGKQGDFSELDEPEPGYIFITPRRVREKAAPMWFEMAASFSIDLWVRPQRLFLGTDIEGGILGCLVTDIPLSRYSGFGLVVSGSDGLGKLIFRATQATNQVSLMAPIVEGTWYHIAATYNAGDLGCTGTTCEAAHMHLYVDAVQADSFTFTQPGSVNYWPANDLTMGVHMPIPEGTGVSFYYAGLLDEVRMWRRELSATEIIYYKHATVAIASTVELGIEAYFPLNSAVCTPEICQASSQQWNPTDDGSFVLDSSPSNSPKCLGVMFLDNQNTAPGTPLEINTCGNSPPDYMRWSRSSTGLLQPAHMFFRCMSIRKEAPWEGQPVVIENCIFDGDNLHQQWTLTATGRIQSVLSQMCLTATNNLIGSSIFVIDCFELEPGEKPQLAVEVANLHHGTLKGGTNFSQAGDNDGCCAPIDVPPRITAIGSDLVIEGQDVLAVGAAGRTLTFEITAIDANQNDKIILNMIVKPNAEARLTRIDSNPAQNPVVYRFVWTPQFNTEWTNPSFAIYQAFDIPTNEYDVYNPAPRDFSFRAVLNIGIRVPPSFVEPTPKDKAHFIVEFGQQLTFRVVVESRNSGDQVRAHFLEEGSSGLEFPPKNTYISPDQPTVAQNILGAYEERFNPTSRSFTFTAEPSDAGKTYEVCFYGTKDGAIGLEKQTDVRCVTISIPTTFPIYLAGTSENNSKFESYPGCFTRFNMTIGQNDTSSAYSIAIEPSVHLYYLYDGTSQLRSGLPQGASFTQIDQQGRSFIFHWDHSLGYEGKWSVCFDLRDNVDIKNLRRCVSILIHRCQRCIQEGDSLHGIANMYGAHWLEIFAVNPMLRGDPDGIRAGQLINVGVTLGLVREQTLETLARHLRTSGGALRLLNPDITSDSWLLQPFDKLCVLPTMCGQDCGGAAGCDRPGDPLLIA